MMKSSSVVLLVAALAQQYILADSESCSHHQTGSVRLVWGSGPWEGNLQVCLNGVWGWVCHNSFSNIDARVVCRQLGFSTKGAQFKGNSYYGWGTGKKLIDYVNCVGTENSLLDCKYSKASTSLCNHGTLAGVVCQSGGSCKNHDIRLITASSSYRSYGRIEYCLNNEWGTVCDDGWDNSDCKVACKQLGFDGQSCRSTCCANYGKGYAPIAIRHVGCSSSSNSLSSCSYIANSVGCSSTEVAGMECFGRVKTPCTNGQFRLWRPFNNTGPSNEGIPLYCKSGVWRTVCSYTFNCYTAKLICKAMGYPGALGVANNYRYYGRYHMSYYDTYYWSCSSSSSSLSQCSYVYSRECCSRRYGYCRSYCNRCTASTATALICYSPSPESGTCANGTVRLVNGSTSNEGRVEYCYDGDWVPSCGMSSITASLICKQLGYNSTFVSVFNDERFGRTNTSSTFNYKYCSRSQSSISNCTDVIKESLCYINPSQCSTEYGLRCYNTGSCSNDGEIRLANGTIEQEGRAEICLNGVWGGICQTSWGTSDALVFCKGLGYRGPNPTTFYGAYFGETEGPIILSNIGCSGFETSIQQCSKSIQPNFNCTQQKSAGVMCKDSCSNGQVKLRGGNGPSEGTVLVCYNNMWGLISDTAWSNGDARVVCNTLGYKNKTAKPVIGSHFGKTNLPLHFKHVSCFGQETSIMHCSKIILSLKNGKLALNTDDVAGVKCIDDDGDGDNDDNVGTRPRGCIEINTVASQCQSNGTIRLEGSEEKGTGRLEYCYNGYWSPFCKLDAVAASVVCKQLGFTNYTAASIIPIEISQNFSLFENITCTGTESSLSNCKIHASKCLKWCSEVLAIKCFNPGMCTNGDIRLVDGIIENEGRIEICTDGVWGAVCDEGWDKTDAHVACTEIGFPQLEPVAYHNSYFGDGKYPIMYSDFSCGGWETNLTDCDKKIFPQSKCSRDSVAGVLCGYDCEDGEIRLVGSEWNYEGTIEICHDHIWGLISDSSWGIQNAEVACRQLGYQIYGTHPYYRSHFGKPPNKTIHISSIHCTGHERTISDCTRTTLSLEEGKTMIPQTNVAGVKCYTPDQCIPPPTGGVSCTSGRIRLTGGGRSGVAEGNIEYCYHGSWSLFCSLGPQEAIVACRQLGYEQYDITAVFNDGRFGLSSVNSLFQNVSCIDAPTATSLSECDLVDKCQSKCQYPIGLRCYESTGECEEGSVRLVNGSTGESGRLEVCTNNIWGSVCGRGFSVTDAYVVCRQMGLGESEPTVYTDSYFGDGNEAIIYSDFNCGGYEETVSECRKREHGSFTCSLNNVVGIICRDNCSNSDVRLVGGPTDYEGILQVCYYNTWGLVSANGWTDREASVVCKQLNYNASRGDAVNGSRYEASRRTIQLINVACTRNEEELDQCDKRLLTPAEGAVLTRVVDVAGVYCIPAVTDTPRPRPSFIFLSSPIEVSHMKRSTKTIYAATVSVLILVIVLIIASCMVIIIKLLKAKTIVFNRQMELQALSNPTKSNEYTAVDEK
ncbi:PREDICTED: scavenger receptor cysteine-rich domain superfamily protein-like isoform X2 [Amphimedon queenslandica]|uniref:SRCR domain-containing protein n=1 Tax=Amphimedon queenslandica TaxID=400682 RepID=A0AAN0J0D8_AMPQE|nr:PREDICTED: scavenger receptor cysteine-rich domain superfamily protein-like isoform X2 [Amphimedon queenslandica]|eukprot:XP_019850479.1 PREDICTED: scavenger receptor cysteine-rich domain superfamily protein-like isoform X2 [Amphimedon queenslandica]